MDYNEFGKRILRLRNEYKMTQRQLADELFVIDKTISRWECGHGFPEVTTLTKICEIFNVPFRMLMDETNNLSDPNVSLDEIRKKYSTAPKEEPQKGSKRINKLPLILGIGGAVIVLIAAITIPTLTMRNTIAYHSWEAAQKSNSDFVFFTCFGKEETMSLELEGNLSSGKFTCIESWVENEGNSILDCKVSGTYSITSESKINFVANDIVDPYSTKKMYTNLSIGVDYFIASVQKTLINDETLTKDNFAGISFMTTDAKSSTSAFGRWTKYKNYFSTVQGEILFQRVNGEFTLNQLSHSPNMMLNDLGVSVPKKIAVFSNPSKTIYIEGEYFQKEGIEIALIYNDGSTYDVTSQVTIKNEDVPLTVETTSMTVVYQQNDLYLTTRIYIKVLSLD